MGLVALWWALQLIDHACCNLTKFWTPTISAQVLVGGGLYMKPCARSLGYATVASQYEGECLIV